MIVKATNATIGYNDTIVLSNVNVEIDKNSVLIGPNGSGKTTFLYAIIGLAKLIEGSFEVFGVDVRSIKKLYGITINLVDAYKILNLPVKDIIEIYADLMGGNISDAYSLLNYFNFNSFNKRVHQLSLGQQKILANVLSLAFKPRLALLDEPFENLDPSRRAKLLKMLNKFESTNIILTSHEMDLVKGLKDWDLYLVFNGKIFGKFKANELEELYVTKGKVENSIALIQTEMGELSITRRYGEVPLSSIGDIENLLGVLNYDNKND